VCGIFVRVEKGILRGMYLQTICKHGRLRDRGVETESLLGWQVTRDV
jgi:hypothetical protein